MLNHALVILARSLHVSQERLYALWSITGACLYKKSAIPFVKDGTLQVLGALQEDEEEPHEWGDMTGMARKL
jgi:hypothetical protein